MVIKVGIMGKIDVFFFFLLNCRSCNFLHVSYIVFRHNGNSTFWKKHCFLAARFWKHWSSVMPAALKQTQKNKEFIISPELLNLCQSILLHRKKQEKKALPKIHPSLGSGWQGLMPIMSSLQCFLDQSLLVGH